MEDKAVVIAIDGKRAALEMGCLGSDDKNEILKRIKKTLYENRIEILEANRKDMEVWEVRWTI